MDLSRFMYKVYDTGNRLSKLNASLNNFMDENKKLLHMIFSSEEVFVSEFLELYDKRTYDIHSRQDDIKYMKELDFKGLYIIKNLSSDKYYLGCGDKVFRKVDRHFRGYGNQKIYVDYKHNNRFVVSFLPFESSGFDNLDDYKNEVRKQLEESKGFRHYDTTSSQQNDKKSSSTDVEKIYVSKPQKKKSVSPKHRKRIIVTIFVIILSFIAYFESKNHIPVSVDSEELLGKNYETVVEELQDAGFLLVQSSPEYSLSIDQIDEDYIVYEVQIGEDTFFKSEDIYRNNVNIVVRYRTLEWKSIPLSSEEMKGQNYEDVLRVLQEAGFVNISFSIEYDLIFGLFKKDGTIEQVTINGNEEFEKGCTYRPDSEIVITYHSYSKNNPNK